MSDNVPNYIPKILKLCDEGKVPRGSFSVVDILHDDWCAVMNGGKICDCDPDVKIRAIAVDYKL